ncbi:ActS/PrrB/RegB family redox-sensitive histidine kinase [Paracoccus aerodenitrificans]|uniref:ActS/PrrB/RegB family redox-sensitive histidine kinase n=1 Tax=Paracoccus aerodenitrificans TaxID=3017781 RepID=UPI0022F05617|nr:ActS/PrrB/RegB family redox-sensitive histidine kinase [Paracoccus aerodenitrificans]WBU63810.1 ActS/PrrB/RegB family redox-sensitive histidine kinase [Paracoccus aerodenitrificans]
MATSPVPGISRLFDFVPRAEPIRRRTLILLRWVALGGQIGAIAVAWIIGVRFSITAALAVVICSALLNLWMTFMPQRLTRRGVAAQLVFDLIQISLLIALTGGLSNPFALLVLAPVTVAATALPTRETLIVGLTTIIMISIAAVSASPLQHATLDLTMPPALLLAHWTAIVIGVVFFAGYARRVSHELAASANALFATQLALAREQKLQHLGGVIAAATHELGTPLGTIKLIATELRDELAEALPDRKDLDEDVTALAQSADRCREIMRSMGRAGKEDLQLRTAPLRTLLEEAAAPHADRSRQVSISLADDVGGLIVRRDPGILHGLRNIIQNAVDYARQDVDIDASIFDGQLSVTIRDDGPGFPADVLSQLDDFLPVARRDDKPAGQEGMGLGLFIARTLLEGSGARVAFGNGRTGAEITVTWPDHRILADDRKALKDNPYLLE